MQELFSRIYDLLVDGGILVAVLVVCFVLWLSDLISNRVTKGRLHPSAIAIFFGLILAYIGGAVTGGMGDGRAQAFEDREALVRALRATAKPGDVLLFKGSRGMHMELALQGFLKDTEE